MTIIPLDDQGIFQEIFRDFLLRISGIPDGFSREFLMIKTSISYCKKTLIWPVRHFSHKVELT
jgi:hypothetical protein